MYSAARRREGQWSRNGDAFQGWSTTSSRPQHSRKGYWSWALANSNWLPRPDQPTGTLLMQGRDVFLRLVRLYCNKEGKYLFAVPIPCVNKPSPTMQSSCFGASGGEWMPLGPCLRSTRSLKSLQAFSASTNCPSPAKHARSQPPNAALFSLPSLFLRRHSTNLRGG